MWPIRPGETVGALRTLVLIALGTALMALSAKVNLPLPYVPMTLQTLVVLMIGAAYGWRLGSATMIAYLAEGAMGLPVFAGPVGGIAPLVGPTAGYLFGFVGAAFVTTRYERRLRIGDRFQCRDTVAATLYVRRIGGRPDDDEIVPGYLPKA